MHGVGEIRTMFSAEVPAPYPAKPLPILLYGFVYCELNFFTQLILLSSTRYFSEGSIIADSRELSKGLMVITSGFVGVELPMDSEEADEENMKPNGSTLLYVLTRG